MKILEQSNFVLPFKMVKQSILVVLTFLKINFSFFVPPKNVTHK